MGIWTRHLLDRSSTLQLLGTHCPAEFSSNPNKIHLNQLIKVFRVTWKGTGKVCWRRLEIHFAGQWVPKSRVEDLVRKLTLRVNSGWLDRQENARIEKTYTVHSKCIVNSKSVKYLYFWVRCWIIQVNQFVQNTNSISCVRHSSNTVCLMVDLHIN